MCKYPDIGSEVTGIVTSLKHLVYSSIEGKVIFYNLVSDPDDLTEQHSVVLHQTRVKCPILSLKLWKNYLYGLKDLSPDEEMLVWDLTT